LTCHQCGHRHKRRPEELEHTCENCGLRADQDERAALNLRQRYYEGPGTPQEEEAETREDLDTPQAAE
jgi:transposase